MDPPDEGWTTVSRGKGTRASHTNAPAINGADRGITVAHLQQELAKKSKLWKQSSARKALLQMLAKNAPDDGWGFTKAVCLATGSFSTQNVELNKRSLLQLALFLDLVEEMSRQSEERLELFAQEPKYAVVDMEFLTQLGVSVLPIEQSEPGLGAALENLGPKTLICDFFMNMNAEMVREFLGMEHGLYVGTPFERKHGEGEEVERSRAKFAGGYVQKQMPRLEDDPGVFEGLCVFWPEPRDEGDEQDDEKVG